MRLVCPNCGAQYEVDDRVMPDNGRDVQCSNCGHAWFQQPAQIDVRDEDDVSPPAPEHETELAPEGERFTPPDRPARTMDDSVRDILQEEAERELGAREIEQEHIEMQPDLGLEDEGEDAGLQARMARLRGLDDGFESSVSPQELKGRDVLPDIDEINSTLDAPERDVGNLGPGDIVTGAKKRSGFRRGFSMMLLLALLLLALYVFAPRLSEMVPQLAPYLDQYVAIVDGLRGKLDTFMQDSIAKMQNMMETPEG